MTSERINIRIGFIGGNKKFIKCNCPDCGCYEHHEEVIYYTEDINEMIRIEGLFYNQPSNIQTDYIDYVHYLTRCAELKFEKNSKIKTQFRLIGATAIQRAEAFCRSFKCHKCGLSIWNCETTECKGGV